MFDHTIVIKKDNKILCAFGSRNMACYDNVHWWVLKELVEIISNDFTSVKELIENVEIKTEYLHFTNEYYDDSDVVDLDNNTLTMPYFPLYKPEEVSMDECCIDLRRDGDNYYAIYEGGQEYLMPHVQFDDVELLRNKVLSIEKFKKVADFVLNLIEKYNDTDFVLNNTLIIRFNFA